MSEKNLTLDEKTDEVYELHLNDIISRTIDGY